MAFNNIFPSFCSLLFLLFTQNLYAQIEKNNELNVLGINISYGNQWPEGDMKDRFGNNLEIGLGMDLITKKHSFILGLGGGFQFGNVVHENVLESIENDDGNIVGRDQGAALVTLKQRGIYLGAHVGKIFPLSEFNKRSGIRVTLGVGLLQHKIRLQDDLETVNIVSGDYAKGFDRLTNGLAIQQFLGYQILSANRLVNFYAGVEVIKAFTKSRRSYDFASRSVDETMRNDILLGLKIGWTLPLYLKLDPDEIYY